MRNRIKHSILLILFGISTHCAIAGTDPVVVSKLQGKNNQNQNEIQVNAFAETIDPVYYSSNISFIDNPANDKYLNTIALQVNEDDRKFIAADFRVTIVFEITWTDKQGNQQGSLQKTLEVDYKIAEGTKYDARNYFYFDNARKVKIKIVSIDIHGASWNPTEVLVIENRMEVKRDYIFSTSGTAANVNAVPGDVLNNKIDELVVSWNQEYFKGITHYDVEWTWVDIDALDRYKAGTQFHATLIFKNNSSRITIPADNNPFKIPLIYDGSGYLFYRVRPLQYREDGDIKEGEWSATGSSGITYYSYSNGHEPDLNWQVSTSYAEDGKRKTVISYFDGTLRSRQTVTKDNVTNKTVVAETLYDYQGRPAINILPAPTLNTVITYAQNFNRFTATGNPKDIYDLVPAGQTICTVNTPVLDNNYGASNYYSPNNPKVNEGFNKYIPDAEGYPYSETRYTPDATGRIASQGGVGPDYQLGAGKHATNYYYGQADQHELNALFGTEVGDQSHYFKNMVRDANGQYSVSYVDMHGRTIATALAGTPPANMQAMESFQTQTLKRNLLGQGNNIVKDRSIESSTTLLVPLAGPHTFHYELSPQSAEIIACNPPGQLVCYDCYYDLEIRITGTCGQTPIIITRRNFTFGTYDVNCLTPSPALTVNETYNLAEGEYNITKKLTLSKDAQDWYRENVFTQKNICKTLLDFYTEIYQVMQAASNCEMTCTSCNTSLGSYQEYRTKFLQSQGVDPQVPAAELPYENEIYASWVEAKAACDALCIDPENKISSLRDLMLQDMTPGQGQYAKLDVDLDDDGISGEPGVVVYSPDDVNHEYPEWEYNTIRKYNIFRTSPPFPNYRPSYCSTAGSVYSPFYTHPKEEGSNGTFLFYKNGNGQRDATINPVGAAECAPVASISPDNFSNQFKESWANALIYYHPEYCKLKKIETTPALVNSYAWDSKLENVDSWQAALTAETSGYILGNTASVSAIINKDPFFSMAGNSSFKNTMLGFVNNDFRGGKSMWQYAMMSVKCANTNDPACLASMGSYPANSTYSQNLCIADMNNAWRIFRNIYLTIKDSLLNVYLDQQCPGIDYNDLTTTLKYKRRFGNYSSFYSHSIDAAVTAIANGADPQTQVSTQLTELYNSTCESYIQMWKMKLLECDQLSAMSAGLQETILNSITQQMKTVCIQGSDPDHPFGSSTIKPGDPWTPQSFEQIITNVFLQYHIGPSALCHKYLIDYPQPYHAQLPTSNTQAVSQKDSCMCARLADLKAEKQNNGFYGNLSQFIQYKHGVFIRQSLLDSLNNGCDPVLNTCNTYDPPLEIPGILDCNSIYTTCISCSEYTTLKNQFIQEFPSFTVIYQNPASDEELNRNIAFERFINRHTSFRKSWTDYLLFEQACQNYNQVWSCTTLDSIVNLFHLADETAYWGPDCELAFTQFFNQAFGSFYTFSGIQALFMQYCGQLPDICRPVIDCPALQQRIADFYLQYGNSIAGSPVCLQQFTNYFNSYYGTEYSTQEIQSMFLQVCGYELDVCSTLNCTYLQQVLNNWHAAYPFAWLMDPPADPSGVTVAEGNTCNLQWTAYFNSQSNTTLKEEEIETLYRQCDIPLTPCLPPISCPILTDYVRAYSNLGATACDSAYLDRNSPTFCQECLTWYVNEQLGTEYNYSQISIMYQLVCHEVLAVCERTYNCAELSTIANDFMALAMPPGACEESFKQYFTDRMGGTGLSFEAIMNIYLSVCGYMPSVCQEQPILTCEQLANVFNRFMQIYPDPAGYFGTTCEEAFKDYFNQVFGSQYSWKEIKIYYVNLCGQLPAVCNSKCTDLQRILNEYILEYGMYPMPQQLCHDLFTQWVNDELAPLEPLTWPEVQTLYANCNIILNICPPATQLLSCEKLEGARAAFYRFYNILPQDCETVFTSFFNLYFQTSFTDIAALQSWVDWNCGTSYNVCNGSTEPLQITLRTTAAPPPTLLPPMLCDAGPLFPTLTDSTAACDDINMLTLNMATEQYNIYIRNKKNEFDKKYKDKCLKAGPLEIFTVESQVAEYHYTLYYYDQAGALVKTVPPAGVKADFSTGFYNSVETARTNVYNGQPPASNIVVPAHILPTAYRYNTLGQVVQQQSPDGGLSKFWYDRLGRLVISQNAKQATGNKYSYTKYDILGRIEEVGQLTSNAAITQATSQDDGLLGSWISNATNSREQITKTKYDVPQDNPDLCTPPSILCQKNLRNRVSYTYVQPSASFNNNNLPYSTATYYTYDIHGNVDILLQHYNDGVMQTVAGNAFKRIEYKYDLVSGKVNEVAYQPGVKDQFYHRYGYDAENKLTIVETSADYIYWQQQATYNYYRHGPLARSEIGHLGVQGTDYVYTLQGWLKGTNSTAIGSGFDPGADGVSAARTGRDAYGFSLNYNTNDYRSINNTVTPFVSGTFSLLNVDANTVAKPLFNGNIAAMMVNIPKLGDAQLYGYNYDQLNRINSLDAFNGFNNASNNWANSAPVATHNYKERVSYDANGNILTYLRNGTGANSNQLAMDNMVYKYDYYDAQNVRHTYIPGQTTLLPTDRPTNRLNAVDDPVTVTNYSIDIDDQSENNYDYDEIGNLIKDNTEGITSIEWTVYGKIKTITKSNNTVTNYTYDASGNRISKQTGDKTTFYVRDASGNVMAIYEKGNAGVNSGKLSQVEADLYGSSRLGLWQRNLDVETTNWWLFETTAMAGTSGGRTAVVTRGTTTYELSNHLGNVLVTLSDRKLQMQDPGNTTQTLYYTADIITATDYYPFGMEMPARRFPDSDNPNNTPGSLEMGTGHGYNSETHIITGAVNNFTVELWVKPTSVHQIDLESQTGLEGIANQKYVIDPIYVGATMDTVGMGISVGTNGVSVYEHAGGYMPPLLVWQGTITDWTHIAVVYENKTPRLYINGIHVRTGLQSLATNVVPGNLVGAGIYGTMTGQVDEVRVWNTVRTQAEILSNMHHAVPTPQSTLVAYWPINPGGSTTLADASGNNHSVTMNNSYSSSNFLTNGAMTGAGIGNYRYGFNGKEKDKDISIDDYDFGARIYDGRIARWLSLDPLMKKYPGESHYIYVSGNPIFYADKDGRDKIVTIIMLNRDGTTTEIRKIDKNYFHYRKDGRFESHGYYYYKEDVHVTITLNMSALDNFDATNLIAGITSTTENQKDISGWDYYFGKFGPDIGDNSDKVQHGFRYYGKGHDMDWQSGLPTAAEGSESIDLSGLLDLVGSVGPNQNYAELYGDVVSKWMKYAGKDMKQVLTALKIITNEIQTSVELVDKMLEIKKKWDELDKKIIEELTNTTHYECDGCFKYQVDGSDSIYQTKPNTATKENTKKIPNNTFHTTIPEKKPKTKN